MRTSNKVHAILEAAVAHHVAGRRAEAERAYTRVLATVPRHPDALHLLGVLATEGGDALRGVRLIRQALAVMPPSADAHSNLGNALRGAGERLDAAQSYRLALRLKPTHVAAHLNLGTTLAELADHAQAVASFERALAIAPESPEGWLGLARSRQALGDLARAEASYRRALQIRGDRAVIVELAAVLLEADRLEEALSMLEQAETTGPASTPSLLARARCEYRLGDVAAAVATCRRAVDLDPTAAAAWNDLGRALRAQGEEDEARRCFLQALAVDPDLVDARRNLASISSASPEAIGALEAALAKPSLTTDEAVLAGFALGKLLDDDDRFDAAFARFRSANALVRETQAARGRRFDAAALRAHVDRLTQTPGMSPDGPATANDDLPVFIVGMPRSGTSLVEQIASSHPDVHGAGELRAIGKLASKLAQGADPRDLAERHLVDLRRRGGDARRVIDKMPDNAFHLGEIARLFPQARVIVCERDARDTCLSNYFQLYTSGNLFSYDLVDCAQRQVETRRLLAYWGRTLALPMLEVSYERLVEDHEPQCRRIIDFLGLEWRPECLDFHRTRRTVTTASAWQVRQPLYTRSVGRWRRYQAHLADLEPFLLENAAHSAA